MVILNKSRDSQFFRIFTQSLLLCVTWLFLFCVCGCETKPIQSNSSLEVWLDPNSSGSQKVEAANKLIPAGTEVDTVIKLLGRDGQFVHYYGPPTIDLYSSVKPSSPYDRYQLEYGVAKMPGELVVLFFQSAHGANGDEFRFYGAVLGHTTILPTKNNGTQ